MTKTEKTEAAKKPTPNAVQKAATKFQERLLSVLDQVEHPQRTDGRVTLACHLLSPREIEDKDERARIAGVPATGRRSPAWQLHVAAAALGQPAALFTGDKPADCIAKAGDWLDEVVRVEGLEG